MHKVIVTRPREIAAVCWNIRKGDVDAIHAFTGTIPRVGPGALPHLSLTIDGIGLVLEPGDWIASREDGGFYVIPAGVFALRYQLVAAIRVEHNDFPAVKA